MSGTLIAYQGLLAQSVVFRRARGFAATLSRVVLPVASFPEGFDFSVPEFDELRSEPDVVLPDTAAIREGRSVTKALPKRLNFGGTLALVEYQGSRDWRLVIHPLYVVRVDMIRSADGGAPAMVKVTLADERMLWSRGFLRRWRFNAQRPDGEVDKTSVKPDGTLYNRREVTAQLLASLPRSPALSASPGEWTTDNEAQEFPPFSASVAALGDVVRELDLAAPCLRLDGTVALHRRGEGRVGYAPQGQGENAKDLPASLLLDKDGTGQGYSAEAAYPDDYVIVTGAPSPRIATVALDHCDPVLVHLNTVRVLNEELLREMLGAEFLETLPKREDGSVSAMDWLRKFVLMPPQVQDSTKLPKIVVKILREQAWRLWRIPGVEVEVGGQEGEFLTAASLGDGEQPGSDNGLNTEPGPNAHLLPLLPRAETTSGKRDPVTVEIFRFTLASRAMRGSRAEVELAEAIRELQSLKNEIIANANATGSTDPFGIAVKWNSGVIGGDRAFIRASLFVGFSRATARLLSYTSIGELTAMMETVRLINNITDFSAGYGKLYEDATVKQLTAENKLGGPGRLEIFKLAKEAVAFEREVNEQFSTFFIDFGVAVEGAALSAKMQGGRKKFSAEAEKILLDVQRRREQFARFGEVGGDATRLISDQVAYFVRNETPDPNAPAVDEPGTDEVRRTRTIRSVDTGARVYSAELGIVQTSVLAGHVEKEGVPSPSATKFVPMPVRVIFGSKLKPSVPGPNVVPLPFPFGLPAPFQVAQNYVPSSLSDAEGYFVRAYRRKGVGLAEEIPLDQVPAGEGVVVRRPEMQELVPMVGEGNGAELEQKAEKIAAERFRPYRKVEGRTHVVARPWPVQCDGVVASVEVRSGPEGTGFETSILTGGDRVGHAAGGASRWRPHNPPPGAGPAS